MISHDSRLDDLHGTKQWRPFTRAQWINPDGTRVTADVIDGEYVQSASTWPRSTARIVVPTDPFAGTGETPGGSPYGGRVRLTGGCQLWTGQEITYPINTLWVTSDAVQRPDGTVEIEAASAEARVSDAGPYGTLDDFPQATTWHAITSVARLVQDALGPVPYTYTDLSNNPVISQYQYSNGDDRWALVEEIIGDAGGEAYFRHDGRLILRDIPYVQPTAVATLRVGYGGNLISYRKIRRWTKNRIKVAIYDQDGATLDYSIVEDSDPTSETYVGSAYGVHAELVKITTKATSVPSDTADRRAQTIYRRRRSLARRWELETLPMPWLEVGDTVRVQTSSDDERQLVESFRFPLSQLGTMTINTQAYTLAALEG